MECILNSMSGIDGNKDTVESVSDVHEEDEEEFIEYHPLMLGPVVESLMNYVETGSRLFSLRQVCLLWNHVALKSSHVGADRIATIYQSGRFPMTKFLETFSPTLFNGFRLHKFDLGNNSLPIQFQEEYLPKAKFVSFIDTAWNYAELNQLLERMPNLINITIKRGEASPEREVPPPVRLFDEMLEIQLQAPPPEEPPEQELPAKMPKVIQRYLISITLKGASLYRWKHLIGLVMTSPNVYELIGLNHVDLEAIVYCLKNITLARAHRVTSLGVCLGRRSDILESLIPLNLKIANLSIGSLESMNGMELPSYSSFVESLSSSLKCLTIVGLEFWKDDFGLQFPFLPVLEYLELDFVTGAWGIQIELTSPALKTLILKRSDLLYKRNFELNNSKTTLPLDKLEHYEFHELDKWLDFEDARNPKQFARILEYVPHVKTFIGQVAQGHLKILLQRIPTLKSLILEPESCFTDADILLVDSDFRPFIGGLEVFILKHPHQCSITDLSLINGFSGCRHLRKLGLPFTQITELGLKTLVGSDNLFYLDLAGCDGITDEELSSFQGTKHIHIQINRLK